MTKEQDLEIFNLYTDIHFSRPLKECFNKLSYEAHLTSVNIPIINPIVHISLHIICNEKHELEGLVEVHIFKDPFSF